MNWNEIVENIKTFFNQPVPIIGCTIGFALIFALAVISKTSIGTRVLKKLTAWYNEIKEKVTAFIQEMNKKAVEMENKYNEQISIAEAKWHKADELLTLIVENSHNVKIKEAYENYKKSIEGYVTDFEIELKAEIEEKVAEIKNAEIDMLKSQIEQLVKKVNEIDKKVVFDIENEKVEINEPDKVIENGTSEVENDGEREEETNTNTEEE